MNQDKIRAVQRMQDYIAAHLQDGISLEQLARAAAYSPWHALRAFSGLTGRTPFEYLRLLRLSTAAKRLRDGRESVLCIALTTGFDSSEGFARAFARAFGLTPSQYRKAAPPIPLFTPYRVSTRNAAECKGEYSMADQIIFVQRERRPARRMILKRGRKADEYFAYCEEVGCDVWGMLESVKGALYESVGAWLPEGLRAPGTSQYVQGVEVPADYDGPAPDGFALIDLPACDYLRFQGEPYDDEQFSEAIGAAWQAMKRFNPATLGLAWADEDSPRFQYAPTGWRGYIEYRPVKEIPPHQR